MQAKVWKEDITQYCAGIGKGRLYTRAEIEKLLKMDPIASES
jgi:hypothetical protein